MSELIDRQNTEHSDIRADIEHAEGAIQAELEGCCRSSGTLSLVNDPGYGHDFGLFFRSSSFMDVMKLV
jgi:hypothetical protein